MLLRVLEPFPVEPPGVVLVVGPVGDVHAVDGLVRGHHLVQGVDGLLVGLDSQTSLFKRDQGVLTTALIAAIKKSLAKVPIPYLHAISYGLVDML